MDSDQIKFTLAAFRPSSDDADDPIFAEALAEVEKDAELKVWFDQQMELNQALTGKLSEIEVPGALRSKIAAGGSVSKKPRRQQWLAIAAAFAVSAVGIAFALTHYSESGPKTVAAYRVDMGSYLSKLLFLDFKSDKLDEVQSWLESEHSVAHTVPVPLQSRPSLGCEVVPWHGRSSYLICFDVDGELVHLFVMPGGADVEGTPSGADRAYASVDDGKWSTLTWSDAGDLYLVATQGDKAFLAAALETQIAKAAIEKLPMVALR